MCSGVSSSPSATEELQKNVKMTSLSLSEQLLLYDDFGEILYCAFGSAIGKGRFHGHS